MNKLIAGVHKCKVHDTLLNGFGTFTFCNMCDSGTDNVPIATPSTARIPEILSSSLLIVPMTVLNSKGNGMIALKVGHEVHRLKLGAQLQGVNLTVVKIADVAVYPSFKTSKSGFHTYKLSNNSYIKAYRFRCLPKSNALLDEVLHKLV